MRLSCPSVLFRESIRILRFLKTSRAEIRSESALNRAKRYGMFFLGPQIAAGGPGKYVVGINLPGAPAWKNVGCAGACVVPPASLYYPVPTRSLSIWRLTRSATTSTSPFRPNDVFGSRQHGWTNHNFPTVTNLLARTLSHVLRPRRGQVSAPTLMA